MAEPLHKTNVPVMIILSKKIWSWHVFTRLGSKIFTCRSYEFDRKLCHFKMVKHSYLVLRFNHSFLHLHILCRKLHVHENYYYLVVNLKAYGCSEPKGYSCVPLACYWKGHLVKLEIALVKGKQLHDKRATEKNVTGNVIKHVYFISNRLKASL